MMNVVIGTVLWNGTGFVIHEANGNVRGPVSVADMANEMVAALASAMANGNKPQPVASPALPAAPAFPKPAAPEKANRYFRSDSGEWMVRIKGDVPQPGDTIQVFRWQDGKFKTEVVTAVSQDQWGWVAAIAKKAKAEAPPVAPPLPPDPMSVSAAPVQKKRKIQVSDDTQVQSA